MKSLIPTRWTSRILLLIAILTTSHIQHQVALSTPSNLPPTFVSISSMRYAGDVFIWGEVQDPDDSNTDLLIEVSGEAGGWYGYAEEDGTFLVELKNLGHLSLDIDIDVEVSDPSGASATEDATITAANDYSS